MRLFLFPNVINFEMRKNFHKKTHIAMYEKNKNLFNDHNQVNLWSMLLIDNAQMAKMCVHTRS